MSNFHAPALCVPAMAKSPMRKLLIFGLKFETRDKVNDRAVLSSKEHKFNMKRYLRYKPNMLGGVKIYVCFLLPKGSL